MRIYLVWCSFGANLNPEVIAAYRSKIRAERYLKKDVNNGRCWLQEITLQD